MALFTEIANERPAYKVKDRAKKIVILFKYHEQHLLREKIELLGVELKRTDQQHEMKLLAEVTKLRNQLENLQ